MESLEILPEQYIKGKEELIKKRQVLRLAFF